MFAEFNWAIRGIRGPHLLHLYICSLFKRVLMPKHCLHDLLSPSKPRDSHLNNCLSYENLLSSGICLTLRISMFVFLFAVA